ncbi:hypothetical protein POVWA1_006500 [Plasmodium ovale wallikeri]|uniref:Uncharacterized protein n=1 Tax=Plasmodium ovale wallikeri TaxID=864142 RepID=A0A1A8YIE0_PLAOA|nr:hypothetical protein POVWA1_006500 [Plasmodium ovale wallikeri]
MCLMSGKYQDCTCCKFVSSKHLLKKMLARSCEKEDQAAKCVHVYAHTKGYIFGGCNIFPLYHKTSTGCWSEQTSLTKGKSVHLREAIRIDVCLCLFLRHNIIFQGSPNEFSLKACSQTLVLLPWSFLHERLRLKVKGAWRKGNKKKKTKRDGKKKKKKEDLWGLFDPILRMSSCNPGKTKKYQLVSNAKVSKSTV